MSHLSFHIMELIFRLFYILSSLITSFLLCASYNLELFLTILSFTPSDSSLFLLSHPFDYLYSYISLSLFISLFYIGLPLLLCQLFLYLRPSIYNLHPNFGLYSLIGIILLWFFTYSCSLQLYQLFFIFLLEPMNHIGQTSLFLWLPNLNNLISLYKWITLIFFIYLISPILLINMQLKYNILEKFLKKRQYMYYIGIFIISIFTPPDIITLICICIPWIILIEGSYWISLIILTYLGPPAARPLILHQLRLDTPKGVDKDRGKAKPS